MKQVAVVVGLTLVAATAATLVIQYSRPHDASVEQAVAKRVGVGPHLEQRAEQRLVRPPSRSEAASAEKRRGLVPAHSLRDDASARDGASKEVVAEASPDEKRAEHDAAVQAGNAIVDRAIQSGQWRSIDYAMFNAATYMLSGEEQADIMARVSGAITRGEVRFEMR